MLQLILTIVIIGVMFFVFVLDGNKSKIGIKDKKGSKNKTTDTSKMNSKKVSNVKNTQKNLPFQKIKANGSADQPSLIIKDNDTYVGVVEMYGVNYNLLSTGEKLVLEEVFQRILNGLDYPIQLYIQSRKINLDNYNNLYKKRIDELKELLKKEQSKFSLLAGKGVPMDELRLVEVDIRRIASQIQYGENIMKFISQFATNADILDKKYFIITTYNYDASQFNVKQTEDEIFATAYNTIGNRLESILASFNGANMEGRILNGVEISELLYTSFNKPDADKYKMTNALYSGFANNVITSRPVEYKIIEEEKRKLNEELDKVLQSV